MADPTDQTVYEPQQPSERQLRVASELEKPAQQARVRQISTGMHGLVLERNDENSLVHWGTTQRPGSRPGDPPVEVKITDWVPNSDLEKCSHPVWYGKEGDKDRALLYDPNA